MGVVEGATGIGVGDAGGGEGDNVAVGGTTVAVGSGVSVEVAVGVSVGVGGIVCVGKRVLVEPTAALYSRWLAPMGLPRRDEIPQQWQNGVPA